MAAAPQFPPIPLHVYNRQNNFAIPAYVAPTNPAAAWCRRCVDHLGRVPAHTCVPPAAGINPTTPRCARCSQLGQPCIMVSSITNLAFSRSADDLQVDSRLDVHADQCILLSPPANPIAVANFQRALADFRQERNLLTGRITRGLVAPVGPPRPGRPRPPTWWFLRLYAWVLLRRIVWFALSDASLLIAALILWSWKSGGSIQAALGARMIVLWPFLWSFLRPFLVTIGILSPPPVIRWYSVFLFRVDLFVKFCQRLAVRLGLLHPPPPVPAYMLIWRRVLAWFAALDEYR